MAGHPVARLHLRAGLELQDRCTPAQDPYFLKALEWLAQASP